MLPSELGPRTEAAISNQWCPQGENFDRFCLVYFPSLLVLGTKSESFVFSLQLRTDLTECDDSSTKYKST